MFGIFRSWIVFSSQTWPHAINEGSNGSNCKIMELNKAILHCHVWLPDGPDQIHSTKISIAVELDCGLSKSMETRWSSGSIRKIPWKINSFRWPRTWFSARSSSRICWIACSWRKKSSFCSLTADGGWHGQPVGEITCLFKGQRSNIVNLGWFRSA